MHECGCAPLSVGGLIGQGTERRVRWSPADIQECEGALRERGDQFRRQAPDRVVGVRCVGERRDDVGACPSVPDVPTGWSAQATLTCTGCGPGMICGTWPTYPDWMHGRMFIALASR